MIRRSAPKNLCRTPRSTRAFSCPCCQNCIGFHHAVHHNRSLISTDNKYTILQNDTQIKKKRILFPDRKTYDAGADFCNILSMTELNVTFIPIFHYSQEFPQHIVGKIQRSGISRNARYVPDPGFLCYGTCAENMKVVGNDPHRWTLTL